MKLYMRNLHWKFFFACDARFFYEIEHLRVVGYEVTNWSSSDTVTRSDSANWTWKTTAKGGNHGMTSIRVILCKLKKKLSFTFRIFCLPCGLQKIVMLGSGQTFLSCIDITTIYEARHCRLTKIYAEVTLLSSQNPIMQLSSRSLEKGKTKMFFRKTTVIQSVRGQGKHQQK